MNTAIQIAGPIVCCLPLLLLLVIETKAARKQIKAETVEEDQ